MNICAYMVFLNKTVPQSKSRHVGLPIAIQLFTTKTWKKVQISANFVEASCTFKVKSVYIIWRSQLPNDPKRLELAVCCRYTKRQHPGSIGPSVTRLKTRKIITIPDWKQSYHNFRTKDL